jgi:maleylpyruvate isomerase
MSHSLADGRRWMAEGTKLMLDAVGGLNEEGLAAASLLPQWTRKHLVAHVAANADAIGNLVHWAATGIETPMYRSAEERAAGIAKGATMGARELDAWLHTSAEDLAQAMDRLTPGEWGHEVRTAQGRVVPASQTPWMRAREAFVHAVDLGTGLGFADLPADFDAALSDEIRAKRDLVELPPVVAGAPLAEITAWLAGRPHSIAGAPEIGPWL